MKRIFLVSLFVLGAISCVPIQERISEVIGGISNADSLLQGLARKEYDQIEASSDMVENLSRSLNGINGLMKEAAQAVARNDKDSAAVASALEKVQPQLKNFLESDINITVTNIPSWRMSAAQANAQNISQKFGEIAGYYATVFPNNKLSKFTTKRLTVVVDPDLLDTMSICQQKFRQLGFMTSLTSVPEPIYETVCSEKTGKCKDKLVGYEKRDMTDCYWQGVLQCGHQMDLRCLDSQIQTQMVMSALTGSNSCADMTRYVGNVIGGCHSPVPVTKSNALHY